MMKWMLAAGAAALAITAPLAAERGGGQGGGNKGHAAHAQKQDRGGGQKAKSQRGGGQKAQSQRGGNRQARAERGGGDRQRGQQMRFVQPDDNRGRGRGNAKVARGEDRGRDRAQAVRIDDNRGRGRGNDGNVRTVKLDKESRGKGNGRFAVVDGNDIIRVRDFDNGKVRFRDVDRDDLFVRQLGWGAGGCPPGLAKKPVACMPPGQAKKLVGQPLVAANRFGVLSPLPASMSNLFWDDDDYYYRWGGGYMYRVDRDDALIASMIPLFGSALLGQPLQPAYMNNYHQPAYFNAFYPNSPYDCYQNGYGYVYETDCATGLVENVIPTYANGYGVGQMLPASYGYYNVPFAYRSSFIDNDDYYYR